MFREYHSVLKNILFTRCRVVGGKKHSKIDSINARSEKAIASADKTEKKLEMHKAECYQKVRQQNENISKQPNMQQYDVRKAKSADF